MPVKCGTLAGQFCVRASGEKTLSAVAATNPARNFNGSAIRVTYLPTALAALRKRHSPAHAEVGQHSHLLIALCKFNSARFPFAV